MNIQAINPTTIRRPSHKPIYRGFPNSFTLPLEQVPLFAMDCKGETIYGPLFDGSAIIDFDADADWYVSDIRLQCENFKNGAANVSNQVYIDQDRNDRLYILLHDVIIARYSTLIEEMVRERLADAGAPLAA